MTAIRLGKRNGVTRYLQIYTILARALADGSIAAGSALPSELELMKRYQVSRNTVRHALSRLEREKRIVRRRGSGTFARQVQSGAPLDTMIAVSAYLQDTGPGSTARTLHYGRTQTPAYILERWPTFGAETLLVERLWSRHKQRAALCTVHIDLTAGHRLRRAALGSTSLIAAIEATGSRIGQVSQRLRAQNADALMAERLGLVPGSAMLLLIRWVHDQTGNPLLHEQLAYRSDMYEIAADYCLNDGDRSKLPPA